MGSAMVGRKNSLCAKRYHVFVYAHGMHMWYSRDYVNVLLEGASLRILLITKV